MSKTAMRYDVHSGATLRVNYENSFFYHGPSTIDEHTITFKIGGHGVIQIKDAMKAASRVMKCSVALDRHELRLSTRYAVQSWAEATLLAEAFVEELNKLLDERNKAGQRHKRYVNRP